MIRDTLKCFLTQLREHSSKRTRSFHANAKRLLKVSRKSIHADHSPAHDHVVQNSCITAFGMKGAEIAKQSQEFAHELVHFSLHVNDRCGPFWLKNEHSVRPQFRAR